MQSIIQNVQASLSESLSAFVTNVILFVPKMLLALVVLAIGVFVARMVYNSFLSLCEFLKLDNLFKSVGFQGFFHEVGLDFSFSHFVAWFFKFLVLFITLISSLSIVGLTTVVNFIQYGLLSFIPNLLTVGIILLITFFVANKLREIVLHSTLVTKNFSPITARVVWFMVVVMGVLTVLEYLNIGTFFIDIVKMFIMALCVGIAAAVALAFGLGAKEEARCLVREWMGKDCADLDCGCDDGMDFECCDCNCLECEDECKECDCCKVDSK